MTMLDRMRRHKSWLKWSLAVIVVAFVLVYVPQFLGPGTTGAVPGDVAATVSGRPITAAVLQRTYFQQLEQLRSSYSQISDDMIRQLGIGTQILQRLVNQQAQLVEAERLGLSVTDGELRERLVRLPMFQENGVFIGETRYRQMLDSSRPPTRATDFENELRQSLMAEKLQGAVTGWIRVLDTDVEQAYRRQNEKVKLDLAIFNANDFRAGIQPTEADLDAEFKKNTETYRIPEKRRVRYLSIDVAALRPKMTVSAPGVFDARYRENASQYATPEQVRASHILFGTPGKDEAAVRKTAEGVLARVKAGGDFAALAKQYSEDEGSKVKGGDVDFFPKGKMVPEFETAAWALAPGQTSDLVKSQFGFHIIRVTEKRAATTRTVDQVRPQIEDQLREEKARAEALSMSEAMAKEISGPADFDRVGKARGLVVGDSGLFSRDEPLAGLGFAPAVAAQAFALEVGKSSGSITTNQGFAFIALTETKPSALPTIADVKDKVRQSVITAKAIEVARARAAQLAGARGNFAAAAKAAGAPVKSTELVTRGSAYPDVGVSDSLDAAVFALKVGETSQPIATDAAVVVAAVRERQDISPDAFATAKDALRSQLTNDRRQAFFAAYMAKAMEKIPVTYNEATISQVLGN